MNELMKLNLTFTVRYTVPAEDCNIPDILEKLRELGEAEILDVKIRKSAEKAE